MKCNRKLLTTLAIVVLLTVAMMQNVMADTVAHWIFQNDPAFADGDVMSDDFKIKDVTGNGNTLVVGKQGNVNDEQLIWAREGYNSARSSLHFNNQKAFADVNASDSFIDIIPVAKWLETVSSAPINNATFSKGFTIEIIFKISPEYDSSYNRYSNLIERQGTVRGKYGDGATDPLFALATSECGEEALITDSNPVGSQLLQMSEDGLQWTNKESDAILVPNKWYHMVAVNDGITTTVYIDGEEAISMDCGAGIAAGGYGWDIGIGRKYNDKEDSTLGNDLKGVLRRVFCGQIAEIKISDSVVDQSQFINTAKTDVSSYLKVEQEVEVEVAAAEAEIIATPVVVSTPEVSNVPVPAPVPQTGNGNSHLVLAALILSLIFGFIVSRRSLSSKN